MAQYALLGKIIDEADEKGEKIGIEELSKRSGLGYFITYIRVNSDEELLQRLENMHKKETILERYYKRHGFN